jgi:hypothetical protein
MSDVKNILYDNYETAKKELDKAIAKLEEKMNSYKSIFLRISKFSRKYYSF